MKHIVFLITLSIVCILGACASTKTDKEATLQEKDLGISDEREKSPTSTNQEEFSHISFPPKISLAFQTVEPQSLERLHMEEMDGLVLKETFEFGKLYDAPIYIEIYTNSLNDTYGVLRYKADKFQLFYQTYHAEGENSLKQHSFKKSEGQVELIGVFTFGTQGIHIIYDKSVNKWFSLPAWTALELIDLDNDGIMEVVEQIQNHNDFPDVSITKWNQDIFERTTLKKAFNDRLNLDANIHRLSVEYRIDNNQVKVIVRVVGNEETYKEYFLRDFELVVTN
jgi:hypothetical protein